MTTRKNKKLRTQAVLVTTKYRGVFFGYLENEAPDTLPNSIRLYRSRNCISWSAELKGFLGLAVSGPSESCKIGPAVPELMLFGVTSIAHVNQRAAKKWEAAP